jgi:hypothetical protein
MAIGTDQKAESVQAEKKVDLVSVNGQTAHPSIEVDHIARVPCLRGASHGETIIVDRNEVLAAGRRGLWTN